MRTFAWLNRFCYTNHCTVVRLIQLASHPVLNFDSSRLSRVRLKLSKACYGNCLYNKQRDIHFYQMKLSWKIISDDAEIMHDSHSTSFHAFFILPSPWCASFFYGFFSVAVTVHMRWSIAWCVCQVLSVCVTSSAFIFYFSIKSSIKCIYVEKRRKHLKLLRSLATLQWMTSECAHL